MLYLFALALGMGVLAKGPIGAIIPAAAIGIFLIVERRADTALAILRPGPLIVAIAVGSAWYIACLFGRRYGLLNRQLGGENFGRLFGWLGAMPPWYYIRPILLNSAPLSLLVPIAVFAAIRADSVDRAGAGIDAATARARSSVRLLAIFWITTVLFFSVVAYKRRAYLLPLWPASAVLLAWWIETMKPYRLGRFRLMRPVVGATCVGLAIFNFADLPAREVNNCGGDSFRPAAQEITRVVGPAEPLFVYGIKGDLAPLLFYLDRDATPISGKLGDAPPGYVIVPAEVWAVQRAEALELEPVLTSRSGGRALVLLRRGKVYANRATAAVRSALKAYETSTDVERVWPVSVEASTVRSSSS